MTTTNTVETVSIQASEVECSGELVVTDQRSLLARTWQRGMATAEYAVGILAAVALALVLLKIFTGAQFASEMLKLVLGILQKAGAQIK